MKIKSQIENDLLTASNRKLNARKTEYLEVSNPELFESILCETLFLPKESSLHERIYCILHEIQCFPKCDICDKKRSYTKYRGYSHTCGSHRCSAKLRNINKCL